MFYKFLNTSSKESNFDLLRSCCFARLMDCINSLLDIILRVSVIRFQSSRLSTTDLGLPSDEVIYSIFGISKVFSMIKFPYAVINQLYHTDSNTVKKTFHHVEPRYTQSLLN